MVDGLGSIGVDFNSLGSAIAPVDGNGCFATQLEGDLCGPLFDNDFKGMGDALGMEGKDPSDAC